MLTWSWRYIDYYSARRHNLAVAYGAFYLHQGEHVLLDVCLFVCLSVCLSVYLSISRITQTVVDEFR